MREPDGVLCLYKPAGMTSHDAVAKVRRLYGTKRVGHTGTLDPMATGLLVVLIGRAAKAAEFLTGAQKEYLAALRLGLTTDTQDITGTVLSEYAGPLPSAEQVTRTALGFLGEGSQIPPMYSAVKIGGRKLVDLARQKIEIERPPRPITVYELHIEPESADVYRLRARVSAGTYIRTLCADMGAALGCGGVMQSLTRTECGRFSIDRALTFERLEEMGPEERVKALLPTERLFADCPAVTLPAFYERLMHAGAAVEQKKLGLDFPVLTRVRLYGARGFFALGEVRGTEEGTVLKPIRQFVLEESENT